jgi:hypothetical protein
MKPLYFILIFFVAMIVSCKKSDTEQYDPALSIPADVPAGQFILDSFPLQVGHQWTYLVQTQRSRGSSNAVTSSFVTVSVAGAVDIDSVHLFKITLDQPGMPAPFLNPTAVSYANSSTALYANMKDGLQRWLLADTAYIPDSSVFVVPRGDTSWVDSSGYIVSQHNFNGYYQVTVPAGTFNCITFTTSRTLYYSAWGDYTCKQYFSDKGLVQQVIAYTESPNGPGIGPTYVTEWTRLVSANF